MTHSSPQRGIRRLPLAAAALVAILAVPLGAGAAHGADSAELPGSALYLNPYSTTLEAGQALAGQARYDAQLLGSVPSAHGSPREHRQKCNAAAEEYVAAAADVGADARPCRVQPAVP